MQLDMIGAGWRFPVATNQRGGVALAQGDEEIEQAIRIILSTPRGSRLMRPEFGSRLHELLFAPINAGTMAAATRHVQAALGYWEPRIEVTEVVVTPDRVERACLLITVNYHIKATYDERALVVPFYTIPQEE